MTRRVVIALASVFGTSVVTMLSAGTAMASVTPGTILRQFTPANVGNGRALAFSPSLNELFYTNLRDTNIYVVSTTNTAIATLHPGHAYGALSWDPTTNKLWGGRYDGSGGIDKINPTTGAVEHKFNFPYPLGDSCYDQVPGLVDGLAYDQRDNTLWTSDDNARTLFHITVAGTVISSSTIPNGLCNTGIAVQEVGAANVPDRLLLGLQSGPDTGPYSIGTMKKANTSVFTSSFNTNSDVGPEGVASDQKTFAPQCAVWTNQFGPTTLTAWAVNCPT